jgi:hypothetical protein
MSVKFKALRTYLPISTLLNSVRQVDLITDPLVFDYYISQIKENGVSGKISVLQDRTLVNYYYTSSFWVQSLDIMNKGKYEIPEGVVVKNDEWHVDVFFIKPCGDCDRALSKKCSCRRSMEPKNEI